MDEEPRRACLELACLWSTSAWRRQLPAHAEKLLIEDGTQANIKYVAAEKNDEVHVTQSLNQAKAS